MSGTSVPLYRELYIDPDVRDIDVPADTRDLLIDDDIREISIGSDE
jgi:hypothetical protein